MLSTTSICHACLAECKEQLFDVSTTDIDNLTYMYKFQVCVSPDLNENSFKQICEMCLNRLRKSYVFRDSVLLAQSALLERIGLGSPENESNDASEFVCVQISTGENKNGHRNGRRRSKTNSNDSPVNATSFEKIYQCHDCLLIFSKRWELQKHIFRTHRNEKHFFCKHCDKSFKQSCHLKEHITSHTGERKYVCSLCEKSFQRVSSLRRHARSHERAPGEKTKKTPFLCNVCGKSFPFSNGVQRHMRVHSGVKNHECVVCKRRFTQSTHLHVHMRTHTGERPYVCDLCGVTFSLNASLQKHMNVHNKIKEELKVDLSQVVESVDQHTGERPYVCDLCGVTFSLNVSLQKHMNVHNKIKEELKVELFQVVENVDQAII